MTQRSNPYRAGHRSRCAFVICLGLLSGISGMPEDPPRRGTGGEPRVAQLRAEAIEHYKSRRYFQAVRALELALESAGEGELRELKELLARTRSALGVELLNSGELRQASESFREALSASPDSYAHFGLGFLHFAKLEDLEARKELLLSLELEPGYGNTHKLLGILEYRAGRLPAARAYLEEAAKLEPGDKETRALLDRWKSEGEYTARFQETSTRRFTLSVDPALPRARVDEVSSLTSEVLAEFERRFQKVPVRRIVLVLFAPETFHRATGSFHWVGGLYDGQVKLPLSGGEHPTPKEAAEFREALRHEMAHAFIREIYPECPNWLNEGIAQHFEGPDRREEAYALLPREPSRRIALRTIPLRLWELDDEAVARQTYLEGLGFVEFLVGRWGEFRLPLLLFAASSQGSFAKACEFTYGLDLERLEALFWSEVARKPSTPGSSPAGTRGERGTR